MSSVMHLGLALGLRLCSMVGYIAFEGRESTDAEKNYTVGEQELLAVHHALHIWRCCLEGYAGPVNVVTDHQPNTFLGAQPNLSWMQARWSEFFSRFKLTWVYRPGRVNAADPLSRSPTFVAALLAQDSGVSPQEVQAQGGLLVAADEVNSLRATIQQGCSPDENFGKDEFIAQHAMTQVEGLWY